MNAVQKGTLIVVGGPTASGKTFFAASLAKHLATEVISADSRQFYHAMRIGTARPGEADLLGVKHHFLGHLDLESTWSAGTFAREVEPVLHDVIAQHGTAVMVGGSGLYLDAVCFGFDPLPQGDHALREKLQQRFKQEGLAPLVAELEMLDPVTHEHIDRHNPHRVIRALEVCHSTGRPISEQRTGPRERTDLCIVRLAMELPREELYARIDARVDRMRSEGLLDEARSLLPFRTLNALQTVGYRELFAHFDGTLGENEAFDLIKQHSRNYAKRQLTWLRRDESWRWMPPDPAEGLAFLQAHDLDGPIP